MKKSVRAFVTELLFSLVVVALSIVLFAISRGYHPTVFGYQVLRVLSGSMSPVLEENDLILIKKVPQNMLEEGDIITFLSDDPFLEGVYNTHRISRIETMTETGEITYITKGDDNELEDLYPVCYDQIAGKYLKTLPHGDLLGRAISSMAGSKVFFFVIMLPLMLCLIAYLWEIFFILVINRESEETGDEEDEDKRGDEGEDTEDDAEDEGACDEPQQEES